MTEAKGQKVAAKLASVASKLDALDKDEQHSQGWHYLSAAKLLEKSRGLLAGAQLVFSSKVISYSFKDVETSEGKLHTRAQFHFRYTVTDGESGDTLETDFVTQSNDASDKAGSKAVTQSLKYVLRQLLLVADRDDDLESESATPSAQFSSKTEKKQFTKPGCISPEEVKQVGRAWASRYKQVKNTTEVDFKPLNEIVERLTGVDRTYKIPAEKLADVLAAIDAWGGDNDIPF